MKQVSIINWMNISRGGKLVVAVMALLGICLMEVGCSCSDNKVDDSDNPGLDSDLYSSKTVYSRDFSMYEVKLGDNHDTIMRKFEKAGLIRPGTNTMRSSSSCRSGEYLDDDYVPFITDNEIRDVANSLVNPVKFSISLTRPLDSAALYYLNDEVDVPFAIEINLDNDEMKKESDPFYNNPFYEKLREKYGEPDTKIQDEGEFKFCAIWSSGAEQLSFYVADEYTYEIRFVSISALKPLIAQAKEKIQNRKNQENKKKQNALDRM
nr:hypothetical protein 16 [Candidatus Hydrogenedentota bacterium]